MKLSSIAAAATLVAALTVPLRPAAALELTPEEQIGSIEQFERVRRRVDLLGPGGAIGAIGFDQLGVFRLWHTRRSNFPNEDSNRVRSVTGLSVEASAGTSPSQFGHMFGVDAGLGLNFPGGGYPGLLHGHLGPHLQIHLPIPLKMTVGLGVGAGTRDVHGYLYPRVALQVSRKFDLAASLYYVHPYASHIGGDRRRIEDPGIGVQRIRIATYITVQDPYRHDAPMGLELMFESSRYFGANEVLASRQIRRGSYLGGGIGLAF